MAKNNRAKEYRVFPFRQCHYGENGNQSFLYMANSIKRRGEKEIFQILHGSTENDYPMLKEGTFCIVSSMGFRQDGDGCVIQDLMLIQEIEVNAIRFDWVNRHKRWESKNVVGKKEIIFRFADEDFHKIPNGHFDHITVWDVKPYRVIHSDKKTFVCLVEPLKEIETKAVKSLSRKRYQQKQVPGAGAQAGKRAPKSGRFWVEGVGYVDSKPQEVCVENVLDPNDPFLFINNV